MSEQRHQMVERQIRARGIKSERVLEAVKNVPRHRFVPVELQPSAYDDSPLPIGEGQTISQPYIVALMTELADLIPGEKVLEVGTGSGYQAAVLGEMTQPDKVYSIEIVPELASQARIVLDELGYKQIHTKVGDGYQGWPEAAPFDAIVVAAAPDHVPQPLLDQLAEGGRLVIPVGPAGIVQTLRVITRKGSDYETRDVLPVAFVPLTRDPS